MSATAMSMENRQRVCYTMYLAQFVMKLIAKMEMEATFVRIAKDIAGYWPMAELLKEITFTLPLRALFISRLDNMEQFSNELREVFSEEQFDLMIRFLEECEENGTLRSTPEEIARFKKETSEGERVMYSERRLGFGQMLRSTRVPGTFTVMVPCPGCGLLKRCDKNTKRFRCQCGIDKPYPLL